MRRRVRRGVKRGYELRAVDITRSSSSLSRCAVNEYRREARQHVDCLTAEAQMIRSGRGYDWFPALSASAGSHASAGGTPHNGVTTAFAIACKTPVRNPPRRRRRREKRRKKRKKKRNVSGQCATIIRNSHERSQRAMRFVSELRENTRLPNDRSSAGTLAASRYELDEIRDFVPLA